MSLPHFAPKSVCGNLVVAGWYRASRPHKNPKAIYIYNISIYTQEYITYIHYLYLFNINITMYYIYIVICV